MKSSFIKNAKNKSAIASILAFIFLLSSCSGDKATTASAEYEPFTVTRGDITVSVTGSGTVEPIEQYEIQSIVTGDIIEDYVTLGAEVKKDDILYVVDSESAQNSIERAEKSYEQQLISHNKKVKDYNESTANRTVEAPVTGFITEMYVENGDEVSVGTKLCEINNSEYLTVRVPFLEGNAKNIYVNQTATIYFDNRNESHTGYVSHVATGTYPTEAGAIVSDIEITFKNPGAILAGEEVTAMVGNFACNDYGIVEESSVKIVTAEVSGEIKNLAYFKGDKVVGGNLLMNIADDDSSSDLRSSELSLENSKLTLDDQIERLDDYTIKSPISGTVISKTMKSGDTLDGNKSSLAIVADMSKLTFDISVDELYIRSLKVGQTVKITADALPDKNFEGVIDTISIIGTATSGVTVYPVTVVISEYEGLLPGMNVDAEIVISSTSDVLMVPVNAVSRGGLVLVEETSSLTGIPFPGGKPSQAPAPSGNTQQKSPQNAPSGPKLPTAPEGYKYIMIETGDANDDYIEVVSGLSEGDVIYVTVVKNTQSAIGFGMGGGMPAGNRGGMGGGMSSGMPAGGRSGMSGGMGGMR